MDHKFNSQEFLKNVSEDLVYNFTKAGRATTPALVGSSRESEVRAKLKMLLPSMVEIGTGCIIDTEGGTSKQTDIVLYEKDHCPVFSINANPEATYYPCEGVIAAGEIKSTLNKKELVDSIEKIKSIKTLKRYSENPLIWRSYGTTSRMEGTEKEILSPKIKPFDQIYGFILCQSFGQKIETLLQTYGECISSSEAYLAPNMLISLEDGVIMYVSGVGNKVVESMTAATHLYHFNTENENFQYLLKKLHLFCTSGRTSDVFPFHRYLLQDSKKLPSNGSSLQLPQAKELSKQLDVLLKKVQSSKNV